MHVTTSFGVFSLTEVVLISIFALLILFVLFTAISKVKSNRNSRFVDAAPALMTSIGILGTFIGIVVGLFAFDPANIDSSIKDLLSGLRTAFVTSVFGMGATIFFKWWDSRREIETSSEGTPSDVSASDMYVVLRQQNDSLNKL